MDENLDRNEAQKSSEWWHSESSESDTDRIDYDPNDPDGVPDYFNSKIDDEDSEWMDKYGFLLYSVNMSVNMFRKQNLDT